MKEELQLPDGPLGKMYERALNIIRKDELCEAKPGWYGVWSQTTHGVWYNVYLGEKGWTCECEYSRGGHDSCKHILISFIMV